VEADAAALRRGVVTCLSCGAVSRAGDGATVDPRRREPPAGMTVAENTNELRIVVPRPPGMPAIGVREGVAGLLAAAGAFVGLLTVPGAACMLAGLGGVVAFFVVAIGLASLRTNLPPLRVEGEVVRPGTTPVRLAAGEIVQIYATKLSYALPSGGPRAPAGGQVSFGLYALMRDGRRVALLTPIASEDIALYAEERLEAHLAIADRAVDGSIERPVAAIPEPDAPVPEAAAIARRCAGCGSEEVLDAEAQRRGLWVCTYCRTVHRFEGDGIRSPEQERPVGLLRIEASEGDLRISHGSSTLVASAASITASDGRELDVGAIADIRVQAVPNAGTALDAIGKLMRVGAYSGDLDPRTLFAGPFVLSAAVGNTLIPLLPPVDRAVEVFDARDALRSRLGLDRPAP